MFDRRHYVPILKGKAGEYGALRQLAAGPKSRLTPIIEIPPIPWDYKNNQPGKTIDDHLKDAAKKIDLAWDSERALFADVGALSEERMRDGRHPLGYLFDTARDRGLELIPVSGLNRDSGYQGAVRQIVARDERGVCVRLEGNDFEDVTELAERLESYLAFLEVVPSMVDVVIDFKEIATAAAPTFVAAKSILETLPKVNEWRTLTWAGSAFPRNLTAFGANQDGAWPRTEWQVWTSLFLRRQKLPRLPTFGDYGINHPEFDEVDPRIVRMSANLRYTVERDWLIFKGRNVKNYGYEQFNELCRRLVSRPEYSQAKFSWGDEYISLCALNLDGPGNATTWRKVGTSHHLTYVAEQIASLPGL
jgi:T4 beta protein